MAIEVTAQDVTYAETFLAEYCSAKVTDGDYTDGSALRDLVIKAIAFNFAYLRKTATQLRVRQSLKSISSVDTSDDAEAADDAVDEILSNWFIKRNTGAHVRLTAYGHISQPVDVTVKTTTVFYKTASLVFLLDNDSEDLFIPAEDLVAVFDATGEVLDYMFPIPLIAELPGKDYEIEPGAFASFDAFNAYVTRVETLEKASGGEDIESSADYLARAENLITVRNLINARSVDAVLRDEFPELKGILTVGMGDPEMMRDLIREPATGLELHVGGHMDMYLFANIVETSLSGVTVGASFPRPDGIINVFRDAHYTSTVHLFTDVVAPAVTPLVQPGMVLRIRDGFTIGPHDYMIREVRDTELLVSERVPFPVATDTASPVGYVTWSIGQNMPAYDDVIPEQAPTVPPAPPGPTGVTSLSLQTPGRVTLPGGPIYRVKDVTIDDPADPDADADDGLVHFNVRVNTTPEERTAPDNEYQILVNNPECHQSMKSFAEVVVGPSGDETKYDGKPFKITYDTLVGFSAVHSYVADRRRRLAAGNPLVRGYHPAYLSFTLEYRLLSTAVELVDNDDVIDFIVDYINNFNPRETMGMNQIADAVRVAFPSIGRIYPFTIYYDVHLPDGRVIQFESDEEVTVPWDATALAAVVAISGSFTNPGDYGLSDDVIRYLTTRDAIQVTQRI